MPTQSPHPHCDGRVQGVSVIFLAGEFTGGAFHCGDFVLRDCDYGLAFDGLQPHHSEEFQGTRFSVVLHSVVPPTPARPHEPSLIQVGFPVRAPRRRRWRHPSGGV